jgi:HEPN domain-containing protein
MKKNNLTIAKEWFAKAGDDELCCEAILKERIAASNACFLAQQMSEKYLKGLLIFSGKELVKTHDLVALMNLLKEPFPSIEKFAKDLLVLSSFYFGLHPAVLPQGTKIEDSLGTPKACNASRRILLWSIRGVNAPRYRNTLKKYIVFTLGGGIMG